MLRSLLWSAVTSPITVLWLAKRLLTKPILRLTWEIDVNEDDENEMQVADDGVPKTQECFDCQVTGLDNYYTSQTGGYSLCPLCFKARQVKGRAKEV